MEDDNPAVDAIAKRLGLVAKKAKVAVELVHHARKTNGQELTTEDSRGGSALIDASRSGRVLNPMSKDEAKTAGVKDSRRLYFRIDAANGKNSRSAPSDKADWYKFAGVDLGNAKGDDHQDNVGVATLWKWPDAFEGVTVSDLRKAQSAIDGGRWRENCQATDWAGIAIAQALGLNVKDAAHKAKIITLLKEWTAKGMFVEVEGLDDKRKKRNSSKLGSRQTTKQRFLNDQRIDSSLQVQGGTAAWIARSRAWASAKV